MNTKFIAATVVALAGLTSIGAFAQTAPYGEYALVVAPVAMTSKVTRAQVQAEYLQARQSKQVAASNEGAIVFAPVARSIAMRSEVRADAVKARQEDGRSVS